MLTITIITVYVIVVGSWIFYELKNAPRGYQDESGFHSIEEKKEG